MTTSTYTQVHVVLSLVGIFCGFVVMFGLLSRKRLDVWTALFLASTVATSATGFGFPFHRLLPPHIVGIISLVVLAVAIVARYPLRRPAGNRYRLDSASWFTACPHAAPSCALPSSP